MKQFFDKRGAWREEDREKGANSGWDFIGEGKSGRYLDLFSRIGFLRAGGGNGISGFHVPRQLH